MGVGEFHYSVESFAFGIDIFVLGLLGSAENRNLENGVVKSLDPFSFLFLI